MAKDYIDELKDSTGAWDKETDYVESHPIRVRGLKQE